MRQVSVTRLELLARKAQIMLAQQGRDLLEQKRTALMEEILRIADTVLERSDVLQQATSHAHLALARAEAVAGPEIVRSTALAARADFPLAVTSVRVMGLPVPHIEQKRIGRPALGRGYTITDTSLTIDETAEAFEVALESILKLAESELRLTRLVAEIKRTSRRLNALEQILIPRLEAEHSFIQMVLDEREREDHFRLKLVKRLLERKRPNGGLL